MKTFLMLLTLGVAVVGCGGGEFDNGIQGRGAADLKAKLNCGPAPVLAADGEAAAEVPALSRAPIDMLKVNTEDGEVTLCDAMKSGGKALTLMTFADPACEDCMAYTGSLSTAFAGADYADNVQSFAVMVPDATSEEAPDAWWVNDVEMNLWHFFNPDPANDNAMVTPVGVVLDGEGRGFVVQDGEDAATIWGMILAAYREAPAP